MTSSSRENPLILHVWPRIGSALSLDPECVAALLYFEVYWPTQYTVQHCTNPDLSPTGQLPYLTHGIRSVSGFHSIVKYVSGLPRGDELNHLSDLRGTLSPVQKAQLSAYVAHAESALGDLVAHVTYALSANWVGSTRLALASAMPAPQRFYLPERIRASYQPRLEAVELWNSAEVEQEEEAEKQRFSFRKATKKNKKAQEKAKFKATLARNKVLEKARLVFDTYSKFLADFKYFYNLDKPSELDFVVAAHTYLLLQDLPDPLLQDILRRTYPNLVAHCEQFYAKAVSETTSRPAAQPVPNGFSFRALLPRTAPKRTAVYRSHAFETQERHFALLRYAFFGGATLLFAGYIYLKCNMFAQYYRALLIQVAVEAAHRRSARVSSQETDVVEVDDEEVEGVDELEDEDED